MSETSSPDTPDEYEFDLFWHALNYRGAHTLHAEAMWLELEACVARIVAKAIADHDDKSR